jgi:hypothetical protein
MSVWDTDDSDELNHSSQVRAALGPRTSTRDFRPRAGAIGTCGARASE